MRSGPFRRSTVLTPPNGPEHSQCHLHQIISHLILVDEECRMASSNTPSEAPTFQEQGSTSDTTNGTQKHTNREKTDPGWGHCK
ncbi:hypothetical protein AHAS_Ahas13G0512700 [Arachis hypogaea]